MAIPHVLLIDNDFQDKKKQTILLFSHDIEVMPVSTLKEGMTAIRNFKVDLVICDMHLADGDADHLIQTLKSSATHNKIPIIVVASKPNDAQRLHVLKMGAAAHMIKDDPHYAATVRETINLHREDYEETSMGISGQLAKLKIVDLLAHLARDEGSGIITIDGNIPMEIHLHDGNIVHARHGITVGKKALFRCLRIAEAAFHFLPEDTKTEHTIQDNLGGLLEEARVSNEKLMANYHMLPHVNYRVRVIQSPTNLKAEARAALEIFKKYPRIGAYLDRLNLPDITCYEYLMTLQEKGFIELVTERKPVRVFTDSSCDLPQSITSELSISVLPLQLKVGDMTYTENPVNHATLYKTKTKYLEQGALHPPEDGKIQLSFLSLVPEYDCLTIVGGAPPMFDKVMGNVTQIMNDGLDGKQLLANELTTLNSHSTSLGLGLLVQHAARLAARGDQIEMIENHLIQCISKLHVIFAVQPEKSFITKKGNSPVLLSWQSSGFQETKRLEKGGSIAESLIREVNKRVDRKTNLHIAVGHVLASKRAEEVAAEMTRSLSLSRVPVMPVGPNTGYQLGEGAIGLAFFQE